MEDVSREANSLGPPPRNAQLQGLHAFIGLRVDLSNVNIHRPDASIAAVCLHSQSFVSDSAASALALCSSQAMGIPRA